MANSDYNQQVVEEFRRLRPDWQNAPDEDVYKALGLPYERPSDLGRSLDNYLPQTKEMLGAGLALAGEGLRRSLGEGPVGNYLRDKGLEMMENSKHAIRSAPEDELTGAWERGGLGSVLTRWLPYQVGQGVGNFAEMATASGLGALAGSAAGPEGTLAGGLTGAVARKVVEKEVIDAAKKIAVVKGEKAAEKFIAKEAGKNAGLLADTAFHGIGETGQQAIEENGIDNVDYSRLLPAAAAHAGLEFVGDKVMLNAFGGKNNPLMDVKAGGAKAMAANVGREILATGAKEAPVEIGQTALERYAAGQNLTDDDAVKDYINAGGAAFGMGVLPAGVGGVRSSFGKKGEDKLPAGASFGEKVGKAAANTVDAVSGLYDRLTKPDNKDADWHVLNTPLDPANVAESQQARNGAAASYARKIWENDATDDAEKDIAAQYMSATQNAKTQAERDMATMQFRDAIVKERNYKDDLGSFVDAVKDFQQGTERRGNAQMPGNTESPAGQLRPSEGKKIDSVFPNPVQTPTDIQVRNPSDPFYVNESGEASRRTTQGESQQQHAAKVAQLWLKNNAQLTDVFPNLNVNDPTVRNAAQGMFDWVGQGMHNFDHVSNSLVQMWGKSAGDMLRSAYQYRVDEGLQDHHPAMERRVNDAANVLDNISSQNQNRNKTLLSLMRPTVKEEFLNNPDMLGALRQLGKVLSDFSNGKNVTGVGTTRELLHKVFGKKNVDAALMLYTKGEEEYLDQRNNHNAVEDEANPETEGEVDQWEGGTQESHGQQVEGVYHAKQNAVEMKHKKNEIVAAGLIPKVTGLWDRLKQDADPEELRKKEDDLIRNEFDHDADNTERRLKNEDERQAMLRYINKTYKVLDSVEPSEHEAVDLSDEQAKAMTDTKGNVTTGRLVLQKKDGSKQTVSVGNIIKVMREVAKQGGFDEHGGSAETNQAGDTHRLIMAGISSLMQRREYSGRVGYESPSGQFSWLNDVEGRTKQSAKPTPDRQLKSIAQLPTDLIDPYTGQTAKTMKAGLEQERRSGEKQRDGDTAYAETDAERRKALVDKAGFLRQKARELAQDGNAEKANKLVMFAKVIEGEVVKGATAINKMHRDLRSVEMGKDGPKKMAAEVRMVDEILGRTLKEEVRTSTQAVRDEEGNLIDTHTSTVTDDFGNATQEGAQTDVRHHVYTETPTEMEEMGKNSDDKSQPAEGEFNEADHGQGFDRDMVGQAVPERDISKAPLKEQIAWLGRQLSKGVPAFVAQVRQMAAEQQFRVREALRSLIKSGELGELETVAKNAAKALRVNEGEGMGNLDKSLNPVQHRANAMSAKDERVLFQPQHHDGFVSTLRNVVQSIARGGKGAAEARTKPILISRTPVVLRQVLSKDGSKPFKRADYLVGQGSTVYLKAADIHGSSEHKGVVPMSVLEKLPALLADPLAVFKSTENSENPASYKIVLDAQVEGRPVIVALEPGKADRKLGGELVNLQLSIFPAKNWELVQKWNELGMLRYYNEKSPLSELGLEQSQTARGNGEVAPAKEGFDASIGVKASPVKVMTRGEVEALPKAAWNAEAVTGKALTDEQQQAIRDELTKTLGDHVKVLFEKFIKGPNGQRWSGDWMPGLIRIALHTGDNGINVARHESFHQFFKWLRDAGAHGVEDLLKNVAQNHLVMKQLRTLLKDHPNALKQLSDPEEAAAYLYQFWRAGQITLGPKNETFFQKVENFIRGVLGLVKQQVRDAAHAEAIMQAFTDGKFAEHPDAAAKVLNDVLKAQREQFENGFWQKFQKADAFRKAVFTAGNVLRDTKNPYLVRIADAFYKDEGTAMGKRQSYFDAVPAERAKYMNNLNHIFKDVDKEDAMTALKFLQTEQDSAKIADPEIKRIVDGVRKHLDEMYDYATARGLKRFNPETHEWEPLPKVKNYFPRVWDMDELMSRGEDFIAKLVEHHEAHLTKIGAPFGKDAKEVAATIHARFVNALGNEDPSINESESALGITPFMQSVNHREMSWIDPQHFTEFMSDDISNILSSYTVQTVKRAEYTSRFGNDGAKLAKEMDKAWAHEAFGGDKAKMQEAFDQYAEAVQNAKKGEKPAFKETLLNMLGAEKMGEVAEKMKIPAQAIMAAEGTLGREIDPHLQKAFGAVTLYQNIRLMAMSLFSSFIDPLGMIVNGGSLNDAYDGFKRGIKEVAKGWKGEYSDDQLSKLAERLGTVDAGSFMNALGQTYSSLYLHGKLRQWSEAMFKLNGMEAWNRAMRIQATGVAMSFIETNLTNPGEHSERRLAELGLTGDAKEYMKDGKLDTENEKVRAGIVRWVNGAILRPNAMHRPVVASDPHYALFYHLKQFTYSFHKTILRRAWVEAQHGNITPAITLAALYPAMMIAADVIKFALLPGDDPPWEKEGLGAAFSHGVMRSNLLGVPQLGIEAFTGHNTGSSAKLLGPAPEQVVQWLTLPFNEKDTVGKEFIGALPGATVLGPALR